MSSLTRESPAKLNLTLRVMHKRSDGYHDIESLVTRIDLCDTISVTPLDHEQLTLECDQPQIPTDERNLALRAARLLAEQHKVRRGAHIKLHKQIPMGAGLGGGSSNAATTLLLLNDLWQLGLNGSALERIGAQLGADVPLFFHTPLAVLLERGERVRDLPFRLNAWCVLVLPRVHCDTPAVYAKWDELNEHPARARLDGLLDMIQAAARGGSTQTDVIEPIMRLLFNDLELAACTLHPELTDVVQGVQRVARRALRMTGSGSAWFRLYQNEADARKLAGQCDKTLDVRVVRVGG